MSESTPIQPRRTRRAKPLLAVGLLLFGLFAATAYVRFRPLTRLELQQQLSDGSGVIAVAVRIVSGFPSSQSLMDHTTLQLTDPLEAHDLTPIGGRKFLVLSHQRRFASEVNVAVDTLKTVGPGPNAILPIDVQIFDLDSRPLKVESATVDTISIGRTTSATP